LAWMRLTLVHIGLTAWPCEPLRAVACEGAWRVHTVTIMLTRRTLLALIDVLTAVHSLVAAGTGACVGAVDGARVTDCIRMAWI
jgi:hypothetical protein